MKLNWGNGCALIIILCILYGCYLNNASNIQRMEQEQAAQAMFDALPVEEQRAIRKEQAAAEIVKEAKRAEKRRNAEIVDKAWKISRSVCQEMYPECNIAGFTRETGIDNDNPNQIIVRFKYTVVNAFGATVQRQMQFVYDLEYTLLDHQDVALGFK